MCIQPDYHSFLKDVNCVVSNLSEVDRRILKRKLNEDSRLLNLQFSSLLGETQSELTKNNCTCEKLLTSIICMGCIKDELKDPLLNELKTPKTVDGLFVVLLENNLVSFLHYELIEIIITSQCKKSIELNQELKLYTESFEDYIKRRVCETSLYRDGQFEQFTGSSNSEEKINLLIITDERWNQFAKYVDITEFETIIAKAFRCNKIFLTLKSIKPQCLKLCYALIPSLVDHIFPLTLEEWNKLRSHGVAQIHCRDYHYMVDRKCKFHMIHVLSDVVLTVMYSTLQQLQEKDSEMLFSLINNIPQKVCNFQKHS